MSYDGTIPDTQVAKIVEQYGHLVEAAGEVGFILVYRAADNTPGTPSRTVLAGRGISNTQLAAILADAVTADAAHGFTR